MGNCTLKMKRQGDSAVDDKDADKQPNEDVTYASINHNIFKKPMRERAESHSDCDYTMVNIPAPTRRQPESECSAKDECDDDYVLMG